VVSRLLLIWPYGPSGVGRRSQVKGGGGVNIEKIEGVRSGEVLCPHQLGVWGLAPEKKIILRKKNYAILSKYWYFFPILQQKVLILILILYLKTRNRRA